MLYTTPQDCPTTNKVERLPQRQKLNFRHVHFLCDLCAFSERRKTAARHSRLPQDCCKTRKVFVRLTLYYASHAFVLQKPQVYREMTVRYIARLPQECCKTYSYKCTTENRTMTTRLQCGNRTTYRFVLRQSCKFCMTVSRLGLSHVFSEVIYL